MKTTINKEAKAIFYLDYDEKLLKTPSTTMFGIGSEIKEMPKLTVTLKAKIIPEEIRDRLNSFLENYEGIVRVEDLRTFLTSIDYKLEDLEDFDRMKHMTEEERKKIR